MDEKIFETLGNHNWETSIVKLTAYVVSICRYNRKKLPERLEPEDIVMEAIDKVYCGDRVWNPDSDPDLFWYLKSVVKSLLSNTITKAEQKNNFVELNDSLFLLATNETENELYCEELDRNIIAAMRGDPELSLVYKSLKDGLKPLDIAEAYSLSIVSIRNAQKRLHRLVLDTLDKISNS